MLSAIAESEFSDFGILSKAVWEALERGVSEPAGRCGDMTGGSESRAPAPD